ncbi:hypothetical protein EDB92DRAFT_1955162 [Lactarius akahatsu]|uniref:Ornithine cyclodeaminase n=1 Tax=Lactarius akahatsu TaxID=416441 RepID=A0AAD4L736_9AGAM|nr:hypothetical protein EDB92DRAFT_1955162 [Lactarius akahatsu]
MPARIADIGTTIKVVSVPLLSGDTRGIPASTLVLDEKSGATKALVNARALTALRTAADTSYCTTIRADLPSHLSLGSVLATVILHPPATAKFRHLVAFGAGLQISSHIRQFLDTYPTIAPITVINRTLNARVTALLGDLQRDYLSTSFVALSSSADELEAAVRQADCICCATSSTSPLFPSEWVRPGTHVVLARARGVVVDSRAACAVEAGELVAAGVPQGAMVEVGELLRRAPAGAEEDSWAWEPDAPRVAELLSAGTGDVTIFKTVGLGVQDVAIAVGTVDQAMEMGICTMVPDFE